MSDKLDSARRHADVTRARLHGTLAEIQHRLAPRTMLHEATTAARERSADAAESIARVVCERPGVVAAAIAGIALLAGHRPITRLFRSLFTKKETGDEDHSFTD